jgi:hypothetical protein
MKKLLFVLVTMFLAVGTLTASTTVIEKKEQPKTLCKLFKEKAKAYKITMRDDDYARATLASYEKRAAVFCAKGK